MKKRYLVFFSLIWILPSVLLSYFRYYDPFLLVELSKLVSAASSQSAITLGEGQQSYNVLLYTISVICNFHPLQLAFLPIGAFLTPYCMYSLSRRLLKSEWLAFLLGTYVAIDFSIFPADFSVFAYAFTHPLFLSFLLLFVLGVQRKSLFAVLALFPVYVTTLFFHPTYASWMALFVAIYWFCTAVSGRIMGKLKHDVPRHGFLPVTMIVTFLGLNFVLYTAYLSRVMTIELSSVKDQFLITMQSYLGLGHDSLGPYTMPASPPTEVIGVVISLRTMLIIIMICYALFRAFMFLGSRNALILQDVRLSYVVILVGAVHVLAYALYGHMSLRFVVIMYPLACVLVLSKVDRRRLAGLFLAAILMAACIQIVSYAVDSESDNAEMLLESEIISSWISISFDDNVTMLSDFYTMEAVALHLASKGTTLQRSYYDLGKYEAVIGTFNLTSSHYLESVDFVVVDVTARSTASIGWTTFEPLSAHSRQVNMNTGLNRIYDGSCFFVLVR